MLHHIEQQKLDNIEVIVLVRLIMLGHDIICRHSCSVLHGTNLFHWILTRFEFERLLLKNSIELACSI